MKLINIDDIEAREVKDDPVFTGGPVHIKSLVDEKTGRKKTGQEIYISEVRFSSGAKNVWHTHPHEQILYVTEGKGIVATEEEEFVVTPGMFVYIAPREKHWHGATDDSPFSQLTITPPMGISF